MVIPMAMTVRLAGRAGFVPLEGGELGFVPARPGRVRLDRLNKLKGIGLASSLGSFRRSGLGSFRRRVGSPHLKLLFDVYHVQIMDGDIIRRIRQLQDVIGHVQTVGNPGRGELDDTQEIADRSIMRALVEIGYNGYVGQEFIPTRDPLVGLREAVTLCDI